MFSVVDVNVVVGCGIVDVVGLFLYRSMSGRSWIPHWSPIYAVVSFSFPIDAFLA